MGRGTIEAIHIAGTESGPITSPQSVKAVAGRGLEGDRYFLKEGETTLLGKKATPERQLTLIEAEAVEAADRDYKLKATTTDIRRNIVTRGVPLNHLVGKELKVGGVRVRVIRLGEPCRHMESLCGIDGIREALVHRGGVRAEILTTGTVRVGDPVEWSE